MEKEYEVKGFLETFKIKMELWAVLFRDMRGKNSQTLLDLEISTETRKQILRQLEVNDFCEGPLDDNLYGVAAMWVFGKVIKGKEVYIKISLGIPSCQTICISFHVAERKMKYLSK